VIEKLNAQLSPHGLTTLGITACRPGDALPEAAPGTPAKSLLLVGNAGSRFWPFFAASPEFSDGKPDPLNRWSARVLTEIADALGSNVVFPFTGPPYWPFQQWAMRAGNISQSPLGVLAHERYGLWFAYRGAFLVAEQPEPAEPPTDGPCERCTDRPCLDACPAEALTRTQPYDVAACRNHITGEGAQTCGAKGCLVRHACPYGQDYAYRPEQTRLHMRAFVT